MSFGSCFFGAVAWFLVTDIRKLTYQAKSL
jgi:hypothetical protein